MMVYLFGRTYFGDRAGFYGGLMVCTSSGVYLFTRVMIPEAIFALELAAFFYLFLAAWNGRLITSIGYWGASAVMGVGRTDSGFNRSPVSVGHPFLFYFVYPELGSLARIALVFQRADFPGHCGSMACAGRGTLTRLSLVLLRQ